MVSKGQTVAVSYVHDGSVQSSETKEDSHLEKVRRSLKGDMLW